MSIRKHCFFGCGRQTLRVIDGDFVREGPRRRQRVLAELYNTKGPGPFEGVDSHLTRLDSLLLELYGTPDEPSNVVLVTLLRGQLASSMQCSFRLT